MLCTQGWAKHRGDALANIKEFLYTTFYILSFNAKDREKMLRMVNMIKKKKKLIQICWNQQNGFKQLSLGQKTLMLYVTGGIITIPCLKQRTWSTNIRETEVVWSGVPGRTGLLQERVEEWCLISIPWFIGRGGLLHVSGPVLGPEKCCVEVCPQVRAQWHDDCAEHLVQSFFRLVFPAWLHTWRAVFVLAVHSPPHVHSPAGLTVWPKQPLFQSRAQAQSALKDRRGLRAICGGSVVPGWQRPAGWQASRHVPGASREGCYQTDAWWENFWPHE